MKTQLTRSKNGAISGNKSKATKAGLSEPVTVNWTAPIKQQQLVDGKAKGVAASARSRKVASPAVPLGWVAAK